jgi:hypothetical protein
MFSSMDRLSSELLDELARIYARAAARDYFSQVLADEARTRERGVTPRQARGDQQLDESRNQERSAG